MADILKATREAADALWAMRVPIVRDGVELIGFAAGRDADGLTPKLYADESGAWVDGAPVWDFQGRDGTGAAIITFLRAFEVLKDQKYLDYAKRAWEGAEAVANDLGGWPQDAALSPDGTFQPATVWGAFGDRLHFVPSLNGCWTMDDSTTQTMCIAAIELARVTKSVEPLQAVHNVRMALGRIGQIGVPQWMPLGKAAAITVNQNADPRNIYSPYMNQQTLNDGATATWARVLMALAEVERELGRHAIAVQCDIRVEEIVDWLTGLPGPGFCQQYNAGNNAIWARHNEPPTFITGELGVVPILQAARKKYPKLAPMIDARLEEYYRWLLSLPAPTGQPNKVWRYYAQHEGKWLPAFARDWQMKIGEEHAAFGGPGQPYTGEFDLVYAKRAIKGTAWDHSRNDVYIGTPAEAVARLVAGNIATAANLAETMRNGTWTSSLGASPLGQRTVTSTARHCLNTLTLLNWVSASGVKIDPPPPMETPKPPTVPPIPDVPPVAVLPPTADDEWFALALSDLRGRRGGQITLGERQYRFNRPWNLRGFEGLYIIGQGPSTRVTFNLSGQDAWCAIDLTASRRCRLADFDIHTVGTVETLILLGREKQAGGSHGEHTFERIQTDAKASIALIVNHGSEECVSTRCEWSNFAAGGGVFFTAHDCIYGARSPFGSFGGGSNTQPMRFIQCHLGVYGDRGDEIIMRVGPMTSWLIVDGGGASAQTQTPANPQTGARAVVLLEPEVNRPIQIVTFRDWQTETFGAKNWLRVEPRDVGGVRAGVAAGVSINGCQLVAREELIYLASGAVLADSRIDRNYLIGGMAQYDWATPGDRPLMRAEDGASSTGNGIILEHTQLRHGSPNHPTFRFADKIIAQGVSA